MDWELLKDIIIGPLIIFAFAFVWDFWLVKRLEKAQKDEYKEYDSIFIDFTSEAQNTYTIRIINGKKNYFINGKRVLKRVYLKRIYKAARKMETIPQLLPH